MTHDESFRLALIEEPADDARRLIYADWLDEQGDPRARFIRAYPQIYAFIASLKTARDVQSPCAVLQGFASTQQADLLHGLSLVLDSHRTEAHFNPKLSGIVAVILDHIERLLAIIPSPANAAALLTMLAAHPKKLTHGRQLASMLATGHGPEVLVPLMEKYSGDARFFELFACLLQELVLRGASLQGQSAIDPIVARMRKENHPLAGLPLFPTELEAEVGPWLPRYGPGGSISNTPSGLPLNPASQVPLEGRTRPIITSVTDVTVTDRIAAAVKGWLGHSNGQIEARIIELDRPLGRRQFSIGFLRSLGLASLEGDIHASWITPVQGFNVLFSAASGGGAYSGRLEGAYGRLAAWQSVSGLVGAPVEQAIQQVATRASVCAWVYYSASNGWFYNVAPDLGLVVVRPGSRSLAVLAATDTD